jgi:integrase
MARVSPRPLDDIAPSWSSDKDIQQILRHANVSVTQQSYIKTATPDALNAMRLLERIVSLPDISESGTRE